MKTFRALLASLALLSVVGCAGVPANLGGVGEMVVMTKSQLKEHWPLICFSPTDVMAKRTADSIDTSNHNRDRLLGEEDCPLK